MKPSELRAGDVVMFSARPTPDINHPTYNIRDWEVTVTSVDSIKEIVFTVDDGSGNDGFTFDLFSNAYAVKVIRDGVHIWPEVQP